MPKQRGFKGANADAYNALTEKWSVQMDLKAEEIAMIILVAESTDQQPDFVAQRFHALRSQAKSAIYDL